jgi:hypothetical protein
MELIAQFRRYADLIAPMIARPNFAPEAESAMAVQVERGVIFPRALLDPLLPDPSPVERLIELSTSPRLSSIAVVDRSGHHRPVYRALLVYAWLKAFQIAYETLPRAQFGRWEEGARAWCDLLEGELGQIDWSAEHQQPGPHGFPLFMPAGRGASATEAAWTALALHVAGKVYIRDAWTDLAADTFGKLVARQQPSGTFLLASGSDNPETHWYHELVILHAAASYAVLAEDRTVASAVARAAEFHMNETQPDHATAQPWGLFAFIWNPATRTLADQLLHATSTQTEGGGVSLMLLADALYCLRLFL